MIPFEQDNLKAYRLLLRIEIALRECLKESMESEFGPQWYKRLPGELLSNIRRAQSEENRPQFNFVSLGPLYYLSFGELLILLQQKSGSAVVKRLGGSCILKQLENILSPRNAVCHSRSVSSVGLTAIEAVYAEIETALTQEVFERLVDKPDVGVPREEAVKVLIPAFQRMLTDLQELPLVLRLPDSIKTITIQFWWSDESFAGFSCSSIEAVLTLISAYNGLPSGVGSAGNRQRFCEEHDLKRRIHVAIEELEKVSR